MEHKGSSDCPTLLREIGPILLSVRKYDESLGWQFG